MGEGGIHIIQIDLYYMFYSNAQADGDPRLDHMNEVNWLFPFLHQGRREFDISKVPPFPSEEGLHAYFWHREAKPSSNANA